VDGFDPMIAPPLSQDDQQRKTGYSLMKRPVPPFVRFSLTPHRRNLTERGTGRFLMYQSLVLRVQAQEVFVRV
jgi:hypothetical protein